VITVAELHQFLIDFKERQMASVDTENDEETSKDKLNRLCPKEPAPSSRE
jgi:hypothetical protein